MIVQPPRNGEVVIEDGYLRVVVQKDGSGCIHSNGEVFSVDEHSPIYVIAARNAGLEIPATAGEK